ARETMSQVKNVWIATSFTRQGGPVAFRAVTGIYQLLIQGQNWRLRTTTSRLATHSVVRGVTRVSLATDGISDLETALAKLASSGRTPSQISLSITDWQGPVPMEECYTYIEEISSLLVMEPITDAIIRTPEYGLTLEQRKRVSIGVNLAAKPEPMLFLSEPNSGIGSQSAFKAVRFPNKLATTGQAILCIIHKTNAAWFGNFNRLPLLQCGGRAVHFGNIDSSVLRSYLNSHSAGAGPIDNIASILEAIAAGSAPCDGGRGGADIWED
ncbi:hypothetical protein FANTH_14945, partial [Fusarium anthophilum]